MCCYSTPNLVDVNSCPEKARNHPCWARNPTDRGKLGSKYHLVVDRNGIPLSVRLSREAGSSQGRPAKLHGDKAYVASEPRRAPVASPRALLAGGSTPLSDWVVTAG